MECWLHEAVTGTGEVGEPASQPACQVGLSLPHLVPGTLRDTLAKVFAYVAICRTNFLSFWLTNKTKSKIPLLQETVGDLLKIKIPRWS